MVEELRGAPESLFFFFQADDPILSLSPRADLCIYVMLYTCVCVGMIARAPGG